MNVNRSGLALALLVSACTANPPAKTAPATKSQAPAPAAQTQVETPTPAEGAEAAPTTTPTPTPALPPPEIPPPEFELPKGTAKLQRYLVHVPQVGLPGLPELFSRDGRLVAIEIGDHCSVWEVETGYYAGDVEMEKCEAHDFILADSSSRLSPDGMWIATPSGDAVSITPVGDSESDKPNEERRLGGCDDCDDVEALAWSPDGASIALARDTRIELWSVTRKRRTARTRLPSALSTGADEGWLAWSPDNHIIALGTEDLEDDDDDDEDYDGEHGPEGPQPTIYVWDASSPRDKPEREMFARTNVDSSRLDPLGRHLYLLLQPMGRGEISEIETFLVSDAPTTGLSLEPDPEDFEYDPDSMHLEPVSVSEPWVPGPGIQHYGAMEATGYDDSGEFEFTVMHIDPHPGDDLLTSKSYSWEMGEEFDGFEHHRSRGNDSVVSGMHCTAHSGENHEDGGECEPLGDFKEDDDVEAVSVDLRWVIVQVLGSSKYELVRNFSAPGDTPKKRRRIRIGEDRGVEGLGFGWGDWLWVQDDEGRLTTRDTTELKRLYRSSGPETPVDGTFNFDRGVLVVTSGDETRVLDTTTWKPRLTLPKSEAHSVAFHPHEPRAALLHAMNGEQELVILDLETNTITKRWPAQKDALELAWRDDGSAIFTGYDRPEWARDPYSGALLERIPADAELLGEVEGDDLDPTWRYIGTSPTTLQRLSDGVELNLGAKVDSTTDGFFDGPRHEPPFGVFRLGPDPLRAPLITSESVTRITHHPGLVADFFAGKPIVDARVFRTLEPPPVLDIRPEGEGYSVTVHTGAAEVTTDVSVAGLPHTRWTDPVAPEPAGVTHTFTVPGGPAAAFRIDACHADGLCAVYKHKPRK